MSLSVLGAAREQSDRVALVFGETALTHRDVGSIVRARAAELAPSVAGASEEHPVALVGRSNRSTIETLLALFELGAPVLLVHPRLTEQEKTALLSGARPHTVIAPNDGHARAPGSMPSHDIAAPPDDDRCLVILHTSGTTGTPRAVSLSRAAFVASARASENNLGWQDEDRWLLCLPIAHIGGLSILTRCLLGRRTVVVPRENQRLDAAALAAIVRETRVTLLSIVPTQLAWLLDVVPRWTPPPHLRAVLVGGAAAAPSLLERARERGVPVLTTYGLTEACSQVATQTYGTTPGAEHGSGRPLRGMELRIDAGQILVRGPSVAGDGWLATGDAGHLDDECRLHVHGRLDDRIVTGGENVHPNEVEAVLERCPGVDGACVFGLEDDTWGQIVAVAVVGSVTDDALAEHCARCLAPHRRPRRIAHLDVLSLNRTGKVDRAKTRELASSGLRPLRAS